MSTAIITKGLKIEFDGKYCATICNGNIQGIMYACAYYITRKNTPTELKYDGNEGLYLRCKSCISATNKLKDKK